MIDKLKDVLPSIIGFAFVITFLYGLYSIAIYANQLIEEKVEKIQNTPGNCDYLVLSYTKSVPSIKSSVKKALSDNVISNKECDELYEEYKVLLDSEKSEELRNEILK